MLNTSPAKCSFWICFFFIFFSCSPHPSSTGIYEEIFKMEKMVEYKDWDGIVEYTAKKCREPKSWILYAEFYNLAQAYRGRQVDELFEIPQNGPDCLMSSKSTGACDPVLVYELFAIGNMSAAQTMATNSLYPSESSGIDYAMLKILTKIELMRGQNKVADKYLKILSKSEEYYEWVANARHDPDIERGRKVLVNNRTFTSGNFFGDLFAIFEANPSNTFAMQYCLSYLLLSKKVELIYLFIERYYGCSGLTRLPIPVQEALVFYVGYMQNVQKDETVDKSWCLSHGVSEDTFQRFEMLATADELRDVLTLQDFKNTFWYYMLYVKI